jgi:hypothetical protein
LHGLGVILDNSANVFNLDNSPAKHRLDLALLGGPIFTEETFQRIKTAMQRILKYLGDTYNDTAVYEPIAGDAFLVPEMHSWKLDVEPGGGKWNDYHKHAVKNYTAQTHWRFFTFMHIVGAAARNSEATHMAMLEQFENGKFYSSAALRAMETMYLQRIAHAMSGKDFHDAAKTVIFRATMPRQSCRSTRPGKIKNH